MSDPFTTVSAAAGVASFGIQVCSGLLEYLGAIKDRQKELGDALDYTRTLIAVFRSLNGVITRIHAQRHEDAALLLQCLQHAMRQLMYLRELVADLAGLRPEQVATIQSGMGPSLSELKKGAGIKEKIRDAGRALVYKFNQDYLKSLRQVLQQLVTTLHLAIATVDLNTEETQVERIEALQASISSLENDLTTSVHAKIQSIDNAIKMLTQQHETSETNVQEAVLVNSEKLDTLQAEFTSLSGSIEKHLTMTDGEIDGVGLQVAELGKKLEEGSARTTSHNDLVLLKLEALQHEVIEVVRDVGMRRNAETANRTALGIVSRAVRYLPPASLQETCDYIFATSPSDSRSTRPNSVIIKPLSSSICTCRTRTARSSTYYLGLRSFGVFFQRQDFSCHAPNCPLYGLSRRKTRRTVGARVRLELGPFLSCFVETYFWLPTGAGGCSFGGPYVRWKNIVPSRNCPVAGELHQLHDWIRANEHKDDKDVVQRFQRMQKNILMTYRRGEASIDDIDESGNNHLQKLVDFLVRGLGPNRMTAEVVGLANTMIQLYIASDLTCDERHDYYSKTSIASYWGYLPFAQTSTTLAKSTALLIQNQKCDRDQHVGLISSIAKVSNPAPEDVIHLVSFTDPIVFFNSILDHEALTDISPLARAIFTKSQKDLNRYIDLYPGSLLDKTYGLTTLHLAATWPQGLARLLQNGAKLLIDTPDDVPRTEPSRFHLVWPFSYAAANNCVQSLDLLLIAGCNVNGTRGSRTTRALSSALEATSAECADVFARHLAQRRLALFNLAKTHLDKIRDPDPKHPEQHELLIDLLETWRASSLEPEGEGMTNSMLGDKETFQAKPLPPDILAPYATYRLKSAKVPVHASLQVSECDGDRNPYQLSGLPLEFFPIFARHGFTGFNEPNRYGLKPIMDPDRSSYLSSSTSLGEEIHSVLPWLVDHGCLDGKPTVPQEQPREEINLSTGVTGWHYLSLTLGFKTWGALAWRAGSWLGMSSSSQHLLARIQELETGNGHRDGCVCPCTEFLARDEKDDEEGTQGMPGGCSPFSFLCKWYFQDSFTFYARKNHFRHHIFRHMYGNSSNDENMASSGQRSRGTYCTHAPRWQLDFLRLLTFEALEMKHTCCHVCNIKPDVPQTAIFEQSCAERERIRADPSEQEKVHQLNSLVAEFMPQLEQTSGSPRDFEKFIYGPWRSRIAGLYAVNMLEDDDGIEEIVGNMKTCKLFP